MKNGGHKIICANFAIRSILCEKKKELSSVRLHTSATYLKENKSFK